MWGRTISPRTISFPNGSFPGGPGVGIFPTDNSPGTFIGRGAALTNAKVKLHKAGAREASLVLVLVGHPGPAIRLVG